MEKSLKKGESLFKEGDSGTLWRVEQGTILLQKATEDGVTLTQIALPGDIIGLEGLCNRPYANSAIALVETKLIQQGVSGDFSAFAAVAGWIQNDRGGRALLKKENGKWSIQVCGGDGLKEVSSLTMAGMDKTSANRLAQKVAMAEKQMTSDQVKKLAMFEGVVKVGAGAHDPHTTHHGHAAHSK